jgi:hypothetical protein
MAASTLASDADIVVAPSRRDGTINANAQRTTEHQALLRDLTASWHHESTVVDRRQNHRIPCEIEAVLLPLDEQDQVAPVEPLAILIANLSKCGVGIVHRHPLPHRLAMIEYTLISGNLVRLMVRLKWCRFKGADFYESGGQILRVNQDSTSSDGSVTGIAPTAHPA